LRRSPRDDRHRKDDPIGSGTASIDKNDDPTGSGTGSIEKNDDPTGPRTASIEKKDDPTGPRTAPIEKTDEPTGSGTDQTGCYSETGTGPSQPGFVEESPAPWPSRAATTSSSCPSAPAASARTRGGLRCTPVSWDPLCRQRGGGPHGQRVLRQ